MAPTTSNETADAGAGISNAVPQSTTAPGPNARRPATITYASVLRSKKTWKDIAEYSDFLQWKFKSTLPISWREGDATDPKVFADAVKAFQIQQLSLTVNDFKNWKAGCCGISKVPSEIRDKIWEWVLMLDHNVDFPQEIGPSVGTSLSAPGFLRHKIFYIHPAITKEATLVWIRLHTLVTHSGPSRDFLQRWLASLPENNGFQNVRSLKFRNFSHFKPELYGPVNQDMQLMKLCTGLTKVEIKLHAANCKVDIVNRHSGDVSYGRRCLDCLLTAFNLREIAHLDMLKLLVIEYLDAYEYAPPNVEHEPVYLLSELKAWILGEFRSRNPHRRLQVHLVPRAGQGRDCWSYKEFLDDPDVDEEVNGSDDSEGDQDDDFGVEDAEVFEDDGAEDDGASDLTGGVGGWVADEGEEADLIEVSDEAE